MALPGTQLANKVLGEIGLKSRLMRQYTYKRAKDRSYKLWGRFNETEGALLIEALASAGAVNARIVYTPNGYRRGERGVSGVRFELASGQ